jgi:hypothetical protein
MRIKLFPLGWNDSLNFVVDITHYILRPGDIIKRWSTPFNRPAVKRTIHLRACQLVCEAAVSTLQDQRTAVMNRERASGRPKGVKQGGFSDFMDIFTNI